MRVFLSWSGPQSKALAAAFKDYLPLVIQAVSPWFSADDIDKGARWLSQLSEELSKDCIGVICVTRDSLNSQWLAFEAGALSKALDATFVCPVLFELAPTDVTGPLAQFQSTGTSKDEVRKLLGTINKRLSSPLSDAQIDATHDALWPKFHERIREIGAMAIATKDEPRSTESMLSELLERVRGIERQLLPLTTEGSGDQSFPAMHVGIATRHSQFHNVLNEYVERLNQATGAREHLQETLRSLDRAIELNPDKTGDEVADMRERRADILAKLEQYNSNTTSHLQNLLSLLQEKR